MNNQQLDLPKWKMMNYNSVIGIMQHSALELQMVV